MDDDGTTATGEPALFAGGFIRTIGDDERTAAFAELSGSDQAGCSTRCRSRSNPARPNICRLM
jgi:hypothetical protein